MSLRIKQARSTYLNDATRHTVELDVFNLAEMRQSGDQGYLREIIIHKDAFVKPLNAVHD